MPAVSCALIKNGDTKLVYFAHGWNLAINQAPLIDDTIEAWPCPVIPALYS